MGRPKAAVGNQAAKTRTHGPKRAGQSRNPRRNQGSPRRNHSETGFGRRFRPGIAATDADRSRPPPGQGARDRPRPGLLRLADRRAGRAADRRADRTADDGAGDRARRGLLFDRRATGGQTQGDNGNDGQDGGGFHARHHDFSLIAALERRRPRFVPVIRSKRTHAPHS